MLSKFFFSIYSVRIAHNTYNSPIIHIYISKYRYKSFHRLSELQIIFWFINLFLFYLNDWYFSNFARLLIK